jgi:hypothetical protein
MTTPYAGAAFQGWGTGNGSIGNDTTIARAPALQCNNQLLNPVACVQYNGSRNL